MDEQTVAERGGSRCSTSWPPIDAAETPDALAAVLGGLQRTGVGGGTGVYVDTDSKDSDPLPGCTSASPGSDCPTSRTTATSSTPRSSPPIREHIAAMFALVYGGDHTETAARIVALETKLAAAHWDVVKRRDADLTYNLRTFADLPAEAPGSTGPAGYRAGHHTRDAWRNSLCASPTT